MNSTQEMHLIIINFLIENIYLIISIIGILVALFSIFFNLKGKKAIVTKPYGNSNQAQNVIESPGAKLLTSGRDSFLGETIVGNQTNINHFNGNIILSNQPRIADETEALEKPDLKNTCQNSQVIIRELQSLFEINGKICADSIIKDYQDAELHKAYNYQGAAMYYYRAFDPIAVFLEEINVTIVAETLRKEIVKLEPWISDDGSEKIEFLTIIKKIENILMSFFSGR